MAGNPFGPPPELVLGAATVDRSRPLARPVAASELRIGDTERERTCEVLRSHFEAGRLDPDELTDRLGAALGARTVGDLAGLTRDLPLLAPSPAPAPASERHGQDAAPPSALRQTMDGLLGFGVFSAAMVIFIMLIGSMMLSPMVTVFSLIGGSLAVFTGAGMTYLTMRWKSSDSGKH